MHEYKKLRVWQESVKLVEQVYIATKKFPKEEKYTLVSQINRSAISISSNIAEGAGRNTDGEFKNHLGTANGSSFELETQLLLANSLGFLNEFEFRKILLTLNNVQKMLFNLIRSLSK
jgi:four helix bundle protein